MDTTNWKWFRYDEIFDIKKGKRLTSFDQEAGDIPYIGAIDSNNGVSAYIANDKHLHAGNTISVSYNGSIGQAYYQDQSFWATDDVNVFYPKYKFNKYIAFFILPLIEKEKYRFCYGRKWTSESMRSSKIPLPIMKDGTPDWQYMEDYVKNTLIPQLPEQARAVWDGEYDNRPITRKKIELRSQEWKKYLVSDLFAISLTKGDIKADLAIEGKIPLISSGETNNGVVKYIDKEGDGKAEIFPQNTLTVDMFGHSYYQNQEFYAVGHGRVNILTPKIKFNKYHGLFITTLIDKEMYRFSYGRAVYSSVLSNLKISLPSLINPDGTYSPDWQFMEDYIKSLPYSKNI